MKVAVIGANGFLGKHLVEALTEAGHILIPVKYRLGVMMFDTYYDENPDCLINLAAETGGFKFSGLDNADIVYLRNAQIQLEGVALARRDGIPKYITILSSCCYPHLMSEKYNLVEEMIMQGTPHPTVAPIAYGKRVAIPLLNNRHAKHKYLGLVLNTLYGPRDYTEEPKAKFVGAIVGKVKKAIANGYKEIPLYGCGSPLRQCTYVGDAAKAIVQAIEMYDSIVDSYSILNIGHENPYSIKQVANTIAQFYGYHGQFTWSGSKDNGQYRKIMSMEKAKSFDINCPTTLEEGLYKSCGYLLRDVPVI